MQGRRGEVAVESHSDAPGRFRPGLKLFAVEKGDSRRELQVEDAWAHKGGVILKFATVDSISEAEALVGCELQVLRSERARLESGWTYVSDLVGCIVFDREREIGRIADVQFGAGEAPLLLVRGSEAEYEIPFAESYLRNLDLAGNRVFMELPAGLLEVNAPLTAEEKARQAGSGLKHRSRSAGRGKNA